MVLPSGNLAVLAYRALDHVKAARAEEVMRKIIFARPLQLDGHIHPHGNSRCLAGEIINLPAAETAARACLVDQDIVLGIPTMAAIWGRPRSGSWVGNHISMTPSCHQAVAFIGSRFACATIAYS